MAEERYYLIYQEASADECLLTIRPYTDENRLAEAINELHAKEMDDYTIIKGKKMKASLRVSVDLQEAGEDD